MTSLIGPSRVDWDVVDEELDRVPDEFKDPRFDSLRHVLDILSAVDAEAALDELKGQQERIEQLVDNVVQGYHSGFNKAIHNYSQILHLFSVSKDQVNKLRSQLEDAQRRLTSQSHSLEIQWKRSMTLGDTVRLLQDVRGLESLPRRVQSLQEAKDWTGAVDLLLEGSSGLARPEYSGIGALKETKRELALLRNSLLKTLVGEIESALYENLAANRQQAVANKGPMPRMHSSQKQSSGISGGPATSFPLRVSGSPKASVPPMSPSQRDEFSHASAKFSLDWRAFSDRISGGSQRPGSKSSFGSLSAACGDVISCATKLGGIAEMQAAIRRHLPVQVKRVILRALEESGSHRADVPQSIEPRISSFAYAVDGATSQAATQLVDRVFDNFLQVLQNLAGIFQQIGSVKPPPSSAALELLLTVKPAAFQAGTSSGHSYAKRELEYAWECIQKEVQALLSELIQPGNASANLAGITSGLPGADGSKLSFSFDVQLHGQAARTLLQRENSLGKWDGPEMPALLQSALWGFSGSTYLTPHLYLPTKSFAEEAVLILTSMDKLADSLAGAWFGSGEKQESRQGLKLFLSTFVENVFMPTLFMDFKTRCADILDDEESMRARAKPQASYSSEVAKGRALLPAVKTAEAFVEELVEWGALMPPFASRMNGLLENVLGKVLAAFQSRMSNLLGTSAAKTLSEDPELAVQMAAEPAAAQLGDAVEFFAGRNGEGIEQFVASILRSGFGNGGDAAEIAVLQRLLQKRPVKASVLLTVGDTSTVMNLAATADSLEYLADVINTTITEQSRAPALQERDSTPKSKAGYLETDFQGNSAVRGNRMAMVMIDHFVDRYRSLAGQCLRALRLDMLLMVIHHLEGLLRGRYICEAAEAQDVDECIGALQRSSSRADDAVMPFLPPEKRAYVFGGMAAAAARFMMWMLPEIKALNQAGLARMCRMLAVLQPFLAALGPAGGLFRPEAARHLEKARAYYAHLTYSPVALIAAAAARPTRFSPKEYLALLEVDFFDRPVEDGHKAEMAKIVLAAAKKQNKQNSFFTRV